jgi:hypothetical protein
MVPFIAGQKTAVQMSRFVKYLKGARYGVRNLVRPFGNAARGSHESKRGLVQRRMAPLGRDSPDLYSARRLGSCFLPESRLGTSKPRASMKKRQGLMVRFDSPYCPETSIDILRIDILRTSLCIVLLTFSVLIGGVGFCTKAVAGVVPGDFEATIVLKHGEEKLSLPISVTVLVASSTSPTPRFSGRVVSGSVSQSIAGGFASTTNEETGGPRALSATVSMLNGVPPLFLVYTPPSPASDAHPGFPDSLTVQFAGYEPAAAKSAVFLGTDPESGKRRTLKDVFAGAFKTSPGAFAAAEEKISALENQVSQLNDSMLAAEEKVATLMEKLESVQAELDPASTAFYDLKKSANNYFTALTARNTAHAALEKSITNARNSLSDVIVRHFFEINAASASETAGLIFEEFVSGFVSPAVQMEDSAALSQFTASLSTLLNAPSLGDLDAAAVEMPFSMPFVFDTLESAKAVWKAFSEQAIDLTNAATSLNRAEVKREEELADLDPELFLKIGEAETRVQSLKKAESSTKNLIGSKQSEVASMKATSDSLNALKRQFVGSRAVSNFAGYGTFQGGLNATTSTAAPPKAILATIAGAAPDGQKFSYSSKLRGGESEDNGVLCVNTIAGKHPLIFNVGYSISGKGAAAVENPLVWSGLELEVKVGRALLPSNVLDSRRTDKGRAMNVFGGPVDSAGLVFPSSTAVSSAVVLFGDPTESGAMDGFAAQINNANVVSKLLVW